MLKPFNNCRVAAFIAAMFLMAACAQLGLPTAETFNQKLAVGYGTVTQVRATATQLLTTKKIGADDAQHVQDQANNARSGLDIARGMSAKDLPAATTKLEMVTTILTAVQAYLSAKGGN